MKELNMKPKFKFTSKSNHVQKEEKEKFQSFNRSSRDVNVMASTLASEDYVKSHARQCPHCNAPIEKNDGCNKVAHDLYYIERNEL